MRRGDRTYVTVGTVGLTVVVFLRRVLRLLVVLLHVVLLVFFLVIDWLGLVRV